MSQNYLSAAQSYTNYIDKNPFSPYKAEAYYWRGMSYLQLKDYHRAADDLERAADESHDKAIRAQALYRLGQAAGLCGNFAKAESVYRKLERSSQSVVGQDELAYVLGLACLRQGKWDDADDHFRSVVRGYPRSNYRKLAEEKLANKDRFFSVQLGAFSSWSAADARQRQLSATGLQTFIRTVVRQGATYYCIRTGKFKTWDAARQYQSSLLYAGHRDVAVVP